MGIISAGIYAAQIIDSGVVEIGKGNFQLGLKLEIIAGQFATLTVLGSFEYPE